MFLGLDWWIWLLIVTAVIGIGYLKLKVFKAMTSKKDNPNKDKED
jgi:UPF0716 family protein affecting phage T7 exclusion